MAAPSSISVTARALRTHLAGAVGLPENQILIGHPYQAARDIEGEANKQFLNLFFYRIDYGSVPVEAASDNPFFLRLFCLITALGTAETVGSSTISAGENDLRLVGGVMKRLHEQPILRLRGDSAEDLAHLQIVLHALTLDELNHIWSTQGQTPYRLSVGYEIALVPLPLAMLVDRAPRVGSIGLDVRAGLRSPGSTPAVIRSQVPAVFVDASQPDWAAHLCWLDADGTLQYSLAFSEGDVPVDLQVIALGEPGVQVLMEWEIWNAETPDSGWTRVTGTPATLPLMADTLNPQQTVPPPESLAQDIAFPLQARGQAMLRAIREVTRPDGSVVRARSNPLLVTVHRA